MEEIMKYGGANEIPQVVVECEADVFDNAIRKFGVENACEWFGYRACDDFTIGSIRELCERSNIDMDE
jgi:hypothetical protein